ncbi:Aspartate/glutamate/uridylate kinase [Mucor mucedo]|uniref:Aspartate/glutamate/uridylate kinase n=1 Tax=Mucor mucedo TaxID=29922 RepID=UPI00221F43CC|nr:Aspartate/glutamate/uridylate kinase [Mucor mucedo]KAI7878363.1 Aspartate/glutamate/uridylate kinase [Mucor mucedo]
MTGPKKIVIVKLGGAAITNKRGVCELAPEKQLEQTLNHVQLAYKILRKSGHQLVLVHGAGSFGHPQAKKYNLKVGWSSSSDDSNPNPSYVKGFSHIRSCLQELNLAIISRLESRNVPVLAIPPIDYIQTQNCEDTCTEEFGYMASRVKKYLDLGFVPVLHGDAVLDDIRGCTILSGDIIMYQLTRLFPAVARCIYITDVSGIYQTDPKLITSESNELLPHVYVQENEEEIEQQEVSDSVLADVTGGMQGKIKWAKKIILSNNSIDTIICKWGSEEALAMMSLQSPNNAIYTMTRFTKKS